MGMDSITAFLMRAAIRSQPLQPLRVFDWDTAARLIVERQPIEAGAGLSGDWKWTGGRIWKDGKPVPADQTYTYLASTWAIPEIAIDGDLIDCWLWQSASPGWTEHTYWPPSALAIIAGPVQATAYVGIPTPEIESAQIDREIP